MKTILATLLLGAALPSLALAQGNAPAMSASNAQAAMVQFGCSTVGPLGVGPDGAYYTQCTKGGRVMNVMMDRTGKVSEASNVGHVTEGQARYVLGDFGCSNVSSLRQMPDGKWQGQCSKGGRTQDVTVDTTGKASGS